MKNLIIVIIGAILVSLFVGSKDYVIIPSTSIRLRVIAASNSVNDQNDKIIVKSALESTIKKMNLSKNYGEVDEYISKNKDSIDASIRNIVDTKERNIPFTSNYGYNYFPEKEWNGVIYPSGVYKSYVVTIGSGEGDNWWCVLYPPICLLDDDNDKYEYRSIIKEIITQYN